jgi:hypothetical protein
VTDPLAICTECHGDARWQGESGPEECWRCEGSGLTGGPRARGWLRRRLNGLTELLALVKPEPLDADCHRAHGDCICELCGESYRDHAVDPRARCVNVLCDGWRVKL